MHALGKNPRRASEDAGIGREIVLADVDLARSTTSIFR